MMTKTFDSDVMMGMTVAGERIMFDPEAMEALADWLEFEEGVEEFGRTVRSAIEARALEYDPLFTGIAGDRVSASYSSRGSKYAAEEGATVPPEFLKVSDPSVDSKAVDDFLKRTGSLPEGIVSPDRKKSVSLRMVKRP